MKSFSLVCVVIGGLVVFGCSVTPDHRGSDSSTAGGALIGAPYGTPVTSASPLLNFSFVGPPATSVGFGSDANLFCFDLHDEGAQDLSVRLPPMQFQTMDGQVITMADPSTGFGFADPVIYDGSNAIITPQGLVSPIGPSQAFDAFRASPISLTAGTTRHLCMQSALVAQQQALQNYANQAYRVVMGDWGPTDVAIVGTNSYLPRTQIVAPAQVIGNPMTFVIDAGAAVPASGVVYTGNTNGYYPPGQVVTPVGGTSIVPVTNTGTVVPVTSNGISALAFDLLADSDRTCIQSIDIERAGGTAAEDGDPPQLVSLEGGSPVLIATGTPFINNEAIFGSHNGGALFCLPDGRPHRFAAIVPTAACQIVIENISTASGAVKYQAVGMIGQ